MKNIKYLILAAIAALTFVSCNKEIDPKREAAPAVSGSVMGVGFATTAIRVTHKPDVVANSFNVQITRLKGALAADVSISVEMNEDFAGFFTIPESVHFDEGSKTAELTIEYNFDHLSVAKPYHILLLLPEADYNPYSTTFIGTDVVFTIDDSVPFAVGTFTSQWFTKDDSDSWEQSLRYSPALQSYIFPDLFEQGFSLILSINGTQDPTGYPWAGSDGSIEPVGEKVNIGSEASPAYVVWVEFETGGLYAIDIDPEFTSYNPTEKTIKLNYSPDPAGEDWPQDTYVIESKVYEVATTSLSLRMPKLSGSYSSDVQMRSNAMKYILSKKALVTK